MDAAADVRFLKMCNLSNWLSYHYLLLCVYFIRHELATITTMTKTCGWVCGGIGPVVYITRHIEQNAYFRSKYGYYWGSQYFGSAQLPIDSSNFSNKIESGLLALFSSSFTLLLSFFSYCSMVLEDSRGLRNIYSVTGANEKHLNGVYLPYTFTAR